MSSDGVVDPETRRKVAAGRRTIGEMLVSARGYLRRVFIVFVVGLLATIYAMRVWIWPQLKRDLLAEGADIVVITPFDVILLQAKIGIMVGILISIPLLLYYGREPLKRRGWYPEDGVARWKLAGIALLSVLLFIGGVVYSYALFFPIMFDFLANNAISAGLAPTYSIVDWTEFILVLGLSFGLAAQLPLAMTALSYSGIVPYETFRDKWKYAIVGMFGFGAVFSPPDPFTQLMWAAPLVGLYAFSLYLAKLAVALKRGGEAIDLRASVRSNVHRLAGTFVLVAGLTVWFFTRGGLAYVNRGVRPRIPTVVRPGPLSAEAVLPLDGGFAGATLLGVVLGGLASGALLLYYLWPSIEEAEADYRRRMGDPTAIDLDELDASGVRAAPAEVFLEMSEDEAVAEAQAAIDAGDPEKARIILDRFDELQETTEEVTEEIREQTGEGEDTPADAAGEDGSEEEGDSAVGQTAAGMVSAFTDEETTEDDIGGYYYDIMFVFGSLRSRAFRIFGVFILVLVGVFSFLYAGGIGTIKRDFIARLPVAVRPDEVNVVTLHPVEALVFEVKIATLLGAVATLPLLLYYVWPALKERGLVTGDRDVFFGWTGAIAAGLFVGSTVGYLYIAPAVVSYLVWDALQANMIIVYRVSNFFWLIFFTTVGIGLMINIPVTMVLFHRGGIVSYQTMRDRWRVVTMAVLVSAAMFTPASVLSMVLVTIPVMLAYVLGLSIIWVYTLGGRRTVQPTARSG